MNGTCSISQRSHSTPTVAPICAEVSHTVRRSTRRLLSLFHSYITLRDRENSFPNLEGLQFFLKIQGRKKKIKKRDEVGRT